MSRAASASTKWGGAARNTCAVAVLSNSSTVGDRSAALRIEYRIKQLHREQKRDLAGLPARIEALCEEMAGS